MEKKGDMGIGTLILFIAFILVAAVAAGVLISTTSALQSKSLETGKATTAEVGTSIKGVEIYGEDATDNGNDKDIEYLYQTIKLSSGSDAIRFEDLLLVVSLNDDSQEYTYNNSGAGFCAAANMVANPAQFGVSYSLQSGSLDGYLTSGDVVKLCYKSPRDIIEGEEVKFNLIPKVGSPLVIDTSMPSMMINKRIYIYP